jgi:hypothetical protein
MIDDPMMAPVDFMRVRMRVYNRLGGNMAGHYVFWKSTEFRSVSRNCQIGGGLMYISKI